MAADWTPDGRDLCVSRLHPNGEVTIELPPGTVLLTATRVRADLLRVLPGRPLHRLPGRRRREGDAHRSRAQGREEPSRMWGPTSGAWPGRRRAGRSGSRRARPRAPGTSTPWTSKGGGGSSTARRASSASSTPLLTAALLLHRSLDRWGAMALLPGSRVEQDVTVYDDSSIGALSSRRPDAPAEQRERGRGARSSAYLRRDGGDPVRVAAGAGVDISPDGRSALIVTEQRESSATCRSAPGCPGRSTSGPCAPEAAPGFPPLEGG